MSQNHLTVFDKILLELGNRENIWHSRVIQTHDVKDWPRVKLNELDFSPVRAREKILKTSP